MSILEEDQEPDGIAFNPIPAPESQDQIVENVIQMYRKRSAMGMKAYGISMNDNPADLIFWARQAQEEAMDLSLYLEKMIQKLVELKKAKE